MSWGTVLKLLVLAIGLRVVWGWAIDEDEADDPPMEVWSGTPAVPTAASGWTYPPARHSSRRRRVGGLP